MDIVDPQSLSGRAFRQPARAADVAHALSISTATVSRAYSKPELVNEKVREEIYAMAGKLGYVPNSAARALRVRRTKLIAVLVPSMDYAIYAKLINSVEEIAASSNYLVLIATTGFDRDTILAKIKLVIERGAEAVICVGKVDDPQLHLLLQARGIPLVSTYYYASESAFPCIGFDNRLAAISVAEYVRELGHKKMALLLGPLKNNERQTLRIEGFQAGFEVSSEHRIVQMIECTYRLDEAASAIDRILDEHPEVTAVACTSDVLATGAIIRCLERGISVPGRLSIIGFDDIELIEALSTKLTTLKVPAKEMGAFAADAVIKWLEEGHPIMSLNLETALIQRASAGPVNDQRL